MPGGKSSASMKDYVKSVDMVFPYMVDSSGNAVTDMGNIFCYCSTLESIPAELFRYNTEVTSFVYAFMKCSISVIPDDLFKYNTKVIQFGACFMECQNLTTIPEDLFKYNTEAELFASCFYEDQNIESIPANLFKYNTKAYGFSSCFSYMINLKTVPMNLFQNVTGTYFNMCFDGDSQITSSVPELWKRTGVNNYTHCYRNCKKAANYSSIPSGWK